MSSFKRIGDKIDLDDDDDKIQDEDDVITLDDAEEGVVLLHGRKYRKFNNISQDSIYHYLFDLKDCKKVSLRGKGTYIEIKPHVCHMECKDSGGLKCDGKCGYGVH